MNSAAGTCDGSLFSQKLIDPQDGSHSPGYRSQPALMSFNLQLYETLTVSRCTAEESHTGRYRQEGEETKSKVCNSEVISLSYHVNFVTLSH